MNWYYAKHGSQQGPVSTEDMKNRIAMGDVSPADLAWTEGMADWTPVGEIPELKMAPPVRDEVETPSAAAAASPYKSPPAPASPAPARPEPVPGQPLSQGLAIGSMICGILGLIGCCLWFLSAPLALVGVILGHIALSKIRGNPATYGGRGMAKAGLITGYLGLLASVAMGAFAVWMSTLTPEEMEERIIRFIPEEQRQEFREKFEEHRRLQER